MTDAHFHKAGSAWLSLRGRLFRFAGVHPWEAESADPAAAAEALRAAIAADPSLGVGEIGLDRLKSDAVTANQRRLFDAQLAIAADCGRPVVLHGARCWGEVVKAAKPFANRIPAFLFHGFSRSGGLIPDIVAMNGYISVGPAVLNDHAVKYRELVRRIPRDRILAETDCDASACDTAETLFAICAKIGELTGIAEDAMDSNAGAFVMSLCGGMR